MVEGNPTFSDAILEWGKVTMGRYWDEGRKVLDELYEEIRPPFVEVHRLIRPTPVCPSPVRKRMTVAALRGYLQTFSCYKTYLNVHDDSTTVEKDPIDALIETQYPRSEEWDSIVVDVEWPTVLIVAKMQ
ncbi:hypothetical protein HDU67_001283 [Dinochytrium kinnereticum]|nr:hypothetical protein HDU67_001283 [Dinochytrium kinnereticum]